MKVVMSLKLVVELESAFDLNKRQTCDYGHTERKIRSLHQLQK